MLRIALAAVLMINVGSVLAADQAKPPSPPARVDPIEANDPQFAGGFDALYQKTWGPGAIPEKYKQLTGVTIAVVERCEACLGWHIREAVRLGSTRAEMVEAIRLGLLTGGSITIPTARKAYGVIDDMKLK